MSYLKSFDEIKSMCRICLTQSDTMVSLENKLDDKSEDSPIISNALENVMSAEINKDTRYPRDVCLMCYGHIRLSYDLKLLFYKSQNILDKYLISKEPVNNVKNENMEQNCRVSSEGTNHSDQLANAFLTLTEIPSKQQNYSEHNTTLEILELTAEGNFTSYANIDTNDKYLEEIKAQQDSESETNIDNTDETESLPKVVKLQIGGNQKNNVRVKWLEGNKFIIEKSSNILHKCCYCHNRYLSKRKLAEHLNVCKKFVMIKCEFCDRTFGNFSSRNHHVKMTHSANPPKFPCQTCNQVFKTSHSRTYHKLTRHSEGAKKHDCKVCGKEFLIKNSLVQHMESHSKDVTRIVCPICGKGFHYRGALFYHMKIHRNERNYVCTFCQKRFLNMASLKRHTRIHTGERPYSCGLCGKAFCSAGELKTHERRHAGFKPFPCVYCKKSFLTPYNLKLHISSHSGTQPCDYCNKSYLNNEALKYHMDIKHNIREAKTVL